MVRFAGIESFSEVAPVQGSTAKSRTEAKRAVKTDAVELSTGAQQLSEVFRLSGGDKAAEIRQELVDAAKKRIEEGTYRLQGVVTLVASRITRYV